MSKRGGGWSLRIGGACLRRRVAKVRVRMRFTQRGVGQGGCRVSAKMLQRPREWEAQ